MIDRFLSHVARALFLMVALVAVPAAAAAPPFDAGAILTRARANYGKLHSYSDTGTVATLSSYPGSGPITESYRFTTLFAVGRHFLFDSTKKSNGERIVVWANGGDFNSWWSATKVHDDYPQGQGDQAFATASYPTAGTVTQIPSLLFSGAGLQSSLTAFSSPQAVGIEAVNGHPCYKIAGRVAIAYGTGTVTGAHKATLWIDQTSFLIRKLFEDTPEDAGASSASTTTITFEPQANASIDPKRFAFAIP